MQSIKKYLMPVVLSAIVCLPFISTAAQAEATVWQAKMWGPPGRITTKRLEAFAQEIEKQTKGQVKMEFSYNTIDAKKVPEAIKAGEYDVGYICSAYFPDKLPLTAVLDLPMFAPANTEALGRVQLALFEHPLIKEEMAKWNMRLLMPAPFPQYKVMGTKPIRKVDDFKGMKVRISKEIGQVLEEYGATSVTVSAPEALNALKEGRVDVVGLPYASTFTSYKLHEVGKYYMPNINMGTLSCHMTVSLSAWNKLPRETQQTILKLRESTIKGIVEGDAIEDKEPLAAFKEKGIEFIEFPSSERARLLAKSAKYWNTWVEARNKEGLKGKEIFEFTDTKIKQYTK